MAVHRDWHAGNTRVLEHLDKAQQRMGMNVHRLGLGLHHLAGRLSAITQNGKGQGR